MVLYSNLPAGKEGQNVQKKLENVFVNFPPRPKYDYVLQLTLFVRWIEQNLGSEK